MISGFLKTFKQIWYFIGKDKLYMVLWCLYFVNTLFTSSQIFNHLVILLSLLIFVKHAMIGFQQNSESVLGGS